MKVYTKIVYDKDDNLIEEHSYNYNGPVAQARKIPWKKGAEPIFQKKAKALKKLTDQGTNSYLETFQNDFDYAENISQSIKGDRADAMLKPGFAKKSEVEMLKDFNPEANSLNKYRAVNTIFTLAALDFTEVNFPETLKTNSPKFVIAKSGGGGNRVANAVHEQHGTVLELFIDELHVDAIVSPSPKNRHSQATGVNFKVIEPYSMGKFLEVLHLGALMAADDLSGKKNTNHYNSPYALIIDFVPEGVFNYKNDVSGLRKIIPIRITSADFNVNAGGSTYDISAIPWNEAGFDDAVVNIPHDITLKGDTVHQILSTGEFSLMNQLNKREEPKKETMRKGGGHPLAKNKTRSKSTLQGVDRADEFMRNRKPNDYVVWFPKDNQLISRNTAPAFKNVDRAVYNDSIMREKSGNQSMYVTSLTKTPSEDKQLQTIFGGRLSLTNSLNEGVRILQDGSDYGDTDMSWYDGNEIGASKMVTDTTFYESLGKSMPDPSENKSSTDKKDKKPEEVEFGGQTYTVLYDKKNKLYKRNKITFNPKAQHFTFEAGTKITHIIEQVILLSEYGRKFDSNKVKNGMVNWFRIQPKVLQLQDTAIAQSYGFHPKVFAYTIITYKVMDNLFLSPTEQANFVPQLRSMTKKKYDYYYTGENLDVLDFDLSFKFAFYQPGMSDRGQAPISATEGSKSGTKNDGTPIHQHRGGNATNSQSGSGTSSVSGSAEKGAEAGTQDENPLIRIARHYNNVIVNSNVDLVSCDLTIMGDPYWMPNSGLGNYIAGPSKVSNLGTVSSFIDSDGGADFTRSQVMCVLNFNTPYDYAMSEQGGQMMFPTVKANSKGSEKIGHFSGLYRVWQVKSEFVSGMFKQVLSMLRVNNQPGAEDQTDGKSGGKVFQTGKADNAEPIDIEGWAEDDVYQGGTYN